MEVVAVVMSGVVMVTFIAGLFDYLGKKAKGGGPAVDARLTALEQRLQEHEQAVTERDEKVRKLEGEISFMTDLLQERGRGAGALPGAG